MKSLSEHERKLLDRLLPAYCDHCAREPGSLLVRYVGHYSLGVTERTRPRTPTKHFLVMRSVYFPLTTDIHRQYDLKGSSHGRRVLSRGKEGLPSTVLKDLDFLDVGFGGMRLVEGQREALMAVMERDVAFLTAARVMDYSLLCGMGQRWRRVGLRALIGVSCGAISRIFRRRATGPMPLSLRSFDEEGELYLGIIDFLQPYGFMKWLETTMKKAMLYETATISCVNPDFYASRFLSFVKEEVFPV